MRYHTSSERGLPVCTKKRTGPSFRTPCKHSLPLAEAFLQGVSPPRQGSRDRSAGNGGDASQARVHSASRPPDTRSPHVRGGRGWGRAQRPEAPPPVGARRAGPQGAAAASAAAAAAGVEASRSMGSGRCCSVAEALLLLLPPLLLLFAFSPRGQVRAAGLLFPGKCPWPSGCTTIPGHR